MPTESSTANRTRDVVQPTLRLAVGIGLAFGIGQLVGWRMAFLAPILATLLLKAPQHPSAKVGIGLVLIITGTFGVALVVILPLLQFPLPALLITVLALYWTFYLGNLGAPALAVLMMLIALTLVPVLGLESVDLSFEVAGGLAQAGFMAVVFSWLAFALLPAAPLSTTPSNRADTTTHDKKQAMHAAWVSTAVTAPVVVVFLNFGLSAYILVLVFITLLAMQPDLTAGIKGGMGLVTGNILGGAIAIVVYELTVLLPNLLFLTLLIVLVCLLLGPRIFAGGATGALCGTALTTVLLIVGMTVSPIGPEADAKFYSRIVQIAAAALYVVAALVLIEGFLKRRRPVLV